MLPKGWKIKIEETVSGETRLHIESPYNTGVVFTTHTATHKGDVLHQLMEELKQEQEEN
jgi:hypothetical protein